MKPATHPYETSAETGNSTCPRILKHHCASVTLITSSLLKVHLVVAAVQRRHRRPQQFLVRYLEVLWLQHGDHKGLQVFAQV